MKDSHFYVLILVLAGMGLFALVFNRQDPTANINEASKTELQVYQVPSGMAHQIRVHMNRHFRSISGDGAQIARVEIMPGGNLTLIGPDHLQRGFAEMIKRLASAEPVAVENYVLSCWVVIAPADLWASLASVSSADFDQQLRAQDGVYLLEYLHITGSAGTLTDISGNRFNMSPDFARNGSQWEGELTIRGVDRDFGATGVRTQIALTPGKPGCARRAMPCCAAGSRAARPWPRHCANA